MRLKVKKEFDWIMEVYYHGNCYTGWNYLVEQFRKMDNMIS